MTEPSSIWSSGKLNLASNKGFTLIEVLMALVIFALITTVTYTALGPAGEGFRQLQQARDDIETSTWTEQQIRNDFNGLTATSYPGILPIRIRPDARGDKFVDELFILSREPGRAGITLIHYKLDEIEGKLIRESRMAWARLNTPSDRMVLGDYDSFHVEVMDTAGQWKQQWRQAGQAWLWPKAVRISTIHQGKKQVWLIPVYQGIP